MANKKFSQFTAGAAYNPTNNGLGKIAGFTTGTTVNNIWTPNEIALGLSLVTSTPYSIYAGDGTITTGRKALLAGTLQFRNSGDSSDVFKLNTDGTFALGLGASSNDARSVAIGEGATANGTFNICIGTGTASGGNSVAIGRSSSSGADAIAIGSSATAGANGISMGQSSVAAGTGIALGLSSNAGTSGVSIGQSSLSATGGIAIGYDSGSSTNNCINIGSTAAGTGANSLTLNATGLSAAPSTASTFGVYMSSNTTPDFRISHDGDSYITGSGKFGIGRSNITATLDVTHYDASRKLASFSDNSQAEVFSIENNGTVKITGQAYTEQHGTPLAGTTIDWNNSNIQYIQLASGANALSLINPKSGATYILQVKQPSSGAAGTITYPTSVKYPGGSKPILTTDNDAIDIITLIYNGTTTHYYANATLDLK